MAPSRQAITAGRMIGDPPQKTGSFPSDSSERAELSTSFGSLSGRKEPACLEAAVLLDRSSVEVVCYWNRAPRATRFLDDPVVNQHENSHDE